MKKPDRKNFHKERIFSLPQNKTDFDFIKEHRERQMIQEKAYEIFERRGRVHGHDWEDWFAAEREVSAAHR